MKPIDRIVLDIETATDPGAGVGWGNLHNAGISVACVYSYLTDSYRFYDHTEAARQTLIARVLQADEVFGFMIAAFDFPVIFKTQRTSLWTSELGEQMRFKTFDLWRLVACGMNRSPESVPPKILGLNQIAFATLGIQADGGKLLDSARAPELYQRGDAASIGMLYSHVLEDVRLERDLTNFALKHGYLIGGDGVQVKLARDIWHKESTRPDYRIPLAHRAKLFGEQTSGKSEVQLSVDVRPAQCMNHGNTAIEAGVPLCGCSIEEVQPIEATEWERSADQ